MAICMLAAMDDLQSLVVTADHREIPSGVPTALQQLGARVELAALPAGDYVVGAQTKIERKTVRDLHSSVASSRFWQQLNRLRAAATYPIVVVEGQDLDAGPLSSSGVRGVLVALGDRGIPVIRSRDPKTRHCGSVRSRSPERQFMQRSRRASSGFR